MWGVRVWKIVVTLNSFSDIPNLQGVGTTEHTPWNGCILYRSGESSPISRSYGGCFDHNGGQPMLGTELRCVTCHAGTPGTCSGEYHEWVAYVATIPSTR